MTTQLDPFGMPADAELAQILAPGFLLDDLADEIPVADPLDQPDCPVEDYPSPQQLADEAGVELPF